ncbi:SDR family oxidoreductase [Nocardioides sp. JQ2195]|uniref:SDR family oxidoreductase n=1 Tax=Nocardioides sp. JQ2195 TaxID=2592334 RepID=UPI00143EA54C|nr:SDR family oxidoreductase [Nocardioides sp. JQ2195]QIX28426.1 SDR family oxidoreductase [Nocardioides sp. JQ2195]
MSSERRGAVVTGAGRGLGKEIARLLVDRGHQVLVTDVDEVAAKAAADEIGGGATSRAVDVRNHAQVEAARDEIVGRAGGLDVWVNNAGVLVTGPAWEQDEAARRLMLEVNAIGTINGTVAALEAMRGKGGGHIVNIASLAGITAVTGEAVYAASKHAVMGFSLSTVADLKAAGVKDVDISCVCPDGIWTPMLHDKLTDPSAALSFSGKLLQPDEVVDAVRRTLDKPKLVAIVPKWRGLVARAGDFIPEFGVAAVPLVVAQGRRAQKRMLAKQEQA